MSGTDGELHGLARNAMAYVLAGGRGSRLLELTDKRAKPAVFFGGKSRIIADSDEAGRGFRSEAGRGFRFEGGHHSDLKPARSDGVSAGRGG